MAKLTFTQLEDLWVSAGGSKTYAAMAAAVAMAESGGNPSAINTANKNGSTDRGLWQINSVHGSQSTLDPMANARSAVAISKGGTDWRPWCTAWSNGACGGTFLGPGSPVLKFITGTISSGVMPTAGNENPTITPATNSTGNFAGEIAAWIASRLGLTDPVTAALKYVGWVVMVLVGIVSLTVGFIVLVLSTKLAQNVLSKQLGLSGEAVPVVNVSVAPVAGPPGPPGPAGAPAPTPAPAPVPAIEPPKPLFPTGSAKRLGPAEDRMRESLQKEPRPRKLRRKAKVGDKLGDVL